MGFTRTKWKVSFLQLHPPPSSPTPKSTPTPKPKSPPKEFICPISQSLMADPVIVSSGQTLERTCVQVCKNRSFTPSLPDAPSPDFSAVIPNIALRLTIFNWCADNGLKKPNPISPVVAERLVQALMAAQGTESESKRTSLTHSRFSSEESVSSFSSEEPQEEKIISKAPESTEEERILGKLRTCEEEGVTHLRHITRTDPTVRIPLCTPRVLSTVRSFLISRNEALQLNALAALVNLSLESVNKVKIVRSGVVPGLVKILKCGSAEAVEYTVSLLFSLSLDDQNKTAIGVLGGLEPLLHLVRSENERVSQESLLSVYHLSLVQINCSKLIKLRAVRTLLSLTKSANFKFVGVVLRILCNLVKCAEGKAAVMDENGVRWLVELMKISGETTSREKCVEVLHGLSCGSMRFRALAKAAGAVEALSEVVERGSPRVREKAKKTLDTINKRHEEEIEDVNWERLLFDADDVSRGVSRTRSGLGVS